MGDYPKLWQLLLEFRRNKDDPDTNLRFIKFIERHQGQYLGEQSASDYLMTAADRINPVLFNRLYSLLQWNQEEPDILAWHHWYNFETTPRKTIEAFVRDSKVKGRPLRMLTDRLIEQNPSWAWSAVLIQLQNRRWQEVRYVVEHAPDKTMPASAKTLTAILNNPQRWYKKNAKNFDKLPQHVCRSSSSCVCEASTSRCRRSSQKSSLPSSPLNGRASSGDSSPTKPPSARRATVPLSSLVQGIASTRTRSSFSPT